ncbi:MAG: stage II sporulation protein P [Lachnospiraceae bacterium]|nr:stage II sporulation protein P [Lachnospiraceae bacterium]
MEEKHSRKAFTGKQAGKLIVLAFMILCIQAAVKSCGAASVSEGQDTIGEAMLKSICDEARTVLYGHYMPGALFMEESSRGTSMLSQEIDCIFPFYGYLWSHMGRDQSGSAEDIRTILLAEAEEETDMSSDSPPAETMPDENGAPGGNEPPGTAGDGTADPNSVPGGNGAEQENGAGQAGTGQMDLADLLRAENEAAARGQTAAFIPHERQTRLDMVSLEDYETLMRQFYTFDDNTAAGSDQLNVQKLMGEDMTVSKEAEGPQILIYHTHAHEAFADSEPGDMSDTIMGVGERLTQILTEEYGYEVLHHLGQYDTVSRDDSYAVALGDLEALLQQYPSIQVVIDLHRDAMPEGTRLVMDLDGRPTARFMFFNGLSRTKTTGNISYLYNENLDSNLAFSFQMQKTAMEYYPNLTRKIFVRGYRYNMHLRPKSLLVELGAQNNTLEEVLNACDPLAHILDLVLSGESSLEESP